MRTIHAVWQHEIKTSAPLKSSHQNVTKVGWSSSLSFFCRKLLFKKTSVSLKRIILSRYDLWALHIESLFTSGSSKLLIWLTCSIGLHQLEIFLTRIDLDFKKVQSESVWLAPHFYSRVHVKIATSLQLRCLYSSLSRHGINSIKTVIRHVPNCQSSY